MKKKNDKFSGDQRKGGSFHGRWKSHFDIRQSENRGGHKRRTIGRCGRFQSEYNGRRQDFGVDRRTATWEILGETAARTENLTRLGFVYLSGSSCNDAGRYWIFRCRRIDPLTTAT